MYSPTPLRAKTARRWHTTRQRDRTKRLRTAAMISCDNHYNAQNNDANTRRGLSLRTRDNTIFPKQNSEFFEAALFRFCLFVFVCLFLFVCFCLFVFVCLFLFVCFCLLVFFFPVFFFQFGLVLLFCSVAVCCHITNGNDTVLRVSVYNVTKTNASE